MQKKNSALISFPLLLNTMKNVKPFVVNMYPFGNQVERNACKDGNNLKKEFRP